jgi:hypothetical protein
MKRIIQYIILKRKKLSFYHNLSQKKEKKIYANNKFMFLSGKVKAEQKKKWE